MSRSELVIFVNKNKNAVNYLFLHIKMERKTYIILSEAWQENSNKVLNNNQQLLTEWKQNTKNSSGKLNKS